MSEVPDDPAGWAGSERPGRLVVSSTPEIDAAIDALVGAPPPLLVVVDFDGTLALPSRDPGAARILPSAQRALRRLAGVAARRPGRLHVVVLTGRTVADVADRVRVGGIDYLGDHGLQRASLPRGGRPGRLVGQASPTFDGYHDPAEVLASGVAADLGSPPWLFVERKGPSVAFHVRQADDIPAAREAVLASIARVELAAGLIDHGLAPYRGRSVVDLRPHHAGGKREAVERLIANTRPGGVLALGDEVSDIDAFDAVLAARSSRSSVGRTPGGSEVEIGLTVAVHGPQGRPAPGELLERADLRVASAVEVGRLLGALWRAIAAERAGDRPGAPAS